MNKLLRILHVEDVRTDRELVIQALRREGLDCEFAYAATEQEFREALDSFPCDIILSDFSLPAFCGIETLALAKAAKPDVPFLFVSGTIGEERAVESLKCGATDYVLKNHLDRLGTAVHRALREAQERAERLHAEQLLRASEERFRQVVENIRDVFWLTDPAKNTILYISPAYEKIWGRTCDSLVQSPCTWLEAIHPEDRERVLDALATKRARGDYDEVYRIVRPDGSLRWIHDRAFPLRDVDGNIYRVAGLAEDITRQRLFEEHIRQAQKMESVGQLAGGVAHDYNNILAASMIQLTLLLDDPALEPRIRKALLELQKGNRQAADLTRQLLMFSRRQVLEIKPIELTALLAEALKMLRRLLGETISILFKGETGEAWVNADSGMMEQILMNLCINARDAMPRGGQLAIRIHQVHLNQLAAECNPEARPGSFICLTVADTGAGMSKEIQQRIFEPFFTTKEAGKGTGLGLATVFGIVKQHQGWIEVHSALGRGSEFRVFLPAILNPALAPAISAPPVIQRGTETILVVEDEAEVRQIIVLCLERAGYRVLQATTGREAMEVWLAHDGRIDLLLTDMVMPESTTGLELARTLRQSCPSLKAVIISGYSLDLVQSGVPAEPGIIFLPKPCGADILTTTLRQCLNAKALLP
ncbi:MAG: sensor hybrid histidine kinase [Pedosphaera sp.]|nr:sensor hybrid histidine kinase [Pedosphaera sp.]